MTEWYFQFGFAPFSGILRGGHLSVVFYGCGDLSMVQDQFSHAKIAFFVGQFLNARIVFFLGRREYNICIYDLKKTIVQQWEKLNFYSIQL